MAGFNSNLEVSPYTFNEMSKPKPRPFEFSYGKKMEPLKAQSSNNPKVKVEDINEGLRSANLNSTKSRMKTRIVDVAKQGVKPIASMATKPVSSQPQDIFSPSGYKALADAELYKTKNNSAAELQYNLDVLKQYTPKANDEANRALGMELSTRLPYATFEKSADLFGGAKTLASAMGTFDTLRYQKGVSMSL